GFFEAAEQYGTLPSFFPEEFVFDMQSPGDVAGFAAAKLAEEIKWEGAKTVYELAGPQAYSPGNVASVFSGILQKPVNVDVVSRDKWVETLLSFGFAPDAADNLAKMTGALLDGVVGP